MNHDLFPVAIAIQTIRKQNLYLAIAPSRFHRIKGAIALHTEDV